MRYLVLVKLVYIYCDHTYMLKKTIWYSLYSISQMLLLMQTDVTARVEIEVRMTALNETQINFLDQVRWILG